MVVLADLSKISSFFIGVIAGITLVFAILMIVISVGKKESKKITGATVQDITKEKINEMIKVRQSEFIHEVEDNEKKYVKEAIKVALSLLKDVAKYYYPDSKKPEYELTIKEACLLIHYITNQIEELFNKPVLKPLSTIKISFIANAIEKSKAVKNNKVVKTAKGAMDKVGDEAIKTAKIFKNTLNPIYWFKKIVVKGTLNAAIKKLCNTGIDIVGNEANKVYSKEAFGKDNNEVLNDDFEEIFNEE